LELGAGGAWFAVSAYGECAWDYGGKGEEEEDGWEIWRETVGEWEDEREKEGGFEWEDVCVSFSPFSFLFFEILPKYR